MNTEKHRFDSAIGRLFDEYTTETGINPAADPPRFSVWMGKRPKISPYTQRQYVWRASKLLGVEIPSPIQQNTIDPALTLLTRESYLATVDNLDRLMQKKPLDSRIFAKGLFVSSAITGFSTTTLLTAENLVSVERADGLFNCEITFKAPEKLAATTITTRYHGLDAHEKWMVGMLIKVNNVSRSDSTFRSSLKKLCARAYSCIETANTVKQCSLWDMRRIYPDVLGYKV